MTGSVACRQCGVAAPLRRGRCGACGAAIELGAVKASDRRAKLLHVVGTEWYWWIGELLALVAVAVVAAGLAPVWLLAVAALILLRPLSRLVLLAVRGLLEGAT